MDMSKWTALRTFDRDGYSVSLHRTAARNMLVEAFGTRGTIALGQITNDAERVTALQVNMVAEAVQAAEARLAVAA
jgi:hypothetical protein